MASPCEAARGGRGASEGWVERAHSSAVTGAHLNGIWNHENTFSPGSDTATTPPWLDVARALSLYGAVLTEHSSTVRQEMAQLTSSWHGLQPVAGGVFALEQRAPEPAPARVAHLGGEPEIRQLQRSQVVRPREQ